MKKTDDHKFVMDYQVNVWMILYSAPLKVVDLMPPDFMVRGLLQWLILLKDIT